MSFGKAELLLQLQSLPLPSGYLVAFSGGLDSHALLHALSGLRADLRLAVRAVHVHHGLQQQADAWVSHCAAVCRHLDIPLVVERLDLAPGPGESVEAAARQARYNAIAAHLRSGEMLLTAQHRDDQAETLMLQLLRGAGIEGLSGMPVCRSWQKGWHARPLLAFEREALECYAHDQQLQWIDDPSNRDERFDRNYLRHRVMPVLRARWPSATATLSRSAENLASALPLLREQAERDVQQCLRSGGCLSVSELLRLPRERQRSALRAWVRSLGQVVPDRARMCEIERSVLHAGTGASPQVAWGEVMLRRYRDRLWLLPRQLERPSQVIAWPDCRELALPLGLGILLRRPAVQGIADRLWREGRVSVRWRTAYTPCRPRGREGTRTFKKICQELGIPPWERERLPLVFVDDSLVAIADYCLCGEPEQSPDDTFSTLAWERLDEKLDTR